ncbi:MAG: ABC transporter ATP-binding protein [Pontibacterium sp.]
MSIAVQGLSFSYTGKKPALTNINFTLASGAFNALLGPNGAGKSTLFALLTRLYRLQQGDIEIGGLSISRSPRAVMQKLGVVFQQSTLDLDLSVRQNLHYHAALHGMPRQQARLAIDKSLEQMAMLERVDDSVRSLNGGHRRRVEIARSLMHQPSVLLLDEPTVGLDPETRKTLNAHVRDLCANENLTVLWATHLIEEVQPQDHTLILINGQLRAANSAQIICQDTQQTNLAEAFNLLTKQSKTEVPA